MSQFIERYAKPKNRRWWETERVLTSLDVAAWQTRAISTITRREVAAVVDKVSERSHSAARHLFAALRRFFSWCVERQILEVSPCTGLKGPPPLRAAGRTCANARVGLLEGAGCVRYHGDAAAC